MFVGLTISFLASCGLQEPQLPRVLSTSERPTSIEIARAPQIEMCRLDAQARDHDGELVRVHTRYLQGFEASILIDLGCERAQVWVRLDRPRMQRLSPNAALGSFDELLAQAQNLPRGVSGVANLDVIFVGRLDGPTPERAGYGHLGARKMQLTVYSVESATSWMVR
jgi:hypothetical protein